MVVCSFVGLLRPDIAGKLNVSFLSLLTPFAGLLISLMIDLFPISLDVSLPLANVFSSIVCGEGLSAVGARERFFRARSGDVLSTLYRAMRGRERDLTGATQITSRENWTGLLRRVAPSWTFS